MMHFYTPFMPFATITLYGDKFVSTVQISLCVTLYVVDC